MANEYTVNQPDLLQQFRFAQLPSEQTLQKTQQARQEGLIAQARQKRLQEQQMEAQALKANQGGFGNQDEFAHWGSALAGLGNVAAGHQKGAENKQARVTNEAMLGQSQAAVAQAEEASRMRQEQNQIAKARQDQFNTEEAAKAQAREGMLNRARQAQSDKLARDRFNYQKSKDNLELQGRNLRDGTEIRVNPESGETIEWRIGANPENPNELGYRWKDADGNEQFDTTPPQLEGGVSPEDLAKMPKLTEDQRIKWKDKLQTKLEKIEEVQTKANAVKDILGQYSDTGDKAGQLSARPQVFFTVSEMMKLAADVSVRGELEGKGQMSHMQTGTTRDGRSESEGITSGGGSITTHENDWIWAPEYFKDPASGKIRRNTQDKEGKWAAYQRIGGPQTTKEDRKTMAERFTKEHSQALRDSVTGGAEMEAEYGERINFEQELDKKGILAKMENLTPEDRKLASAYMGLFGAILRAETGLEAPQGTIQNTFTQMGLGPDTPPEVMVAALDRIYNDYMMAGDKIINRYDSVGIQGHGTSIAQEYLDDNKGNNFRSNIRAPQAFTMTEGTPANDPHLAEKETMKFLQKSAGLQQKAVAQPVLHHTMGIHGDSIPGKAAKAGVGVLKNTAEALDPTRPIKGAADMVGKGLGVLKETGKAVADKYGDKAINYIQENLAGGDQVQRVAASFLTNTIENVMHSSKRFKAMQAGDKGYADALDARIRKSKTEVHPEDQQAFIKKVMLSDNRLSPQMAEQMRQNALAQLKKLRDLENM